MTLRLAALSAVASVASIAFAAEGDRPRTLRSPKLYYLDHQDESRPLREMPVLAPRAEERRSHPVKLLHPPRPFPRRFADPAVQAAGPNAPSVGPLVATTAGLNFDGIGVGLPGFTVTSAPPDTNGAVGSTQYVQWVNTSFAVFNKSTGALVYGPAAGLSLWQGFGGPCEANNDGDPIALYDRKANRWLMTQFSVSGGQFWQCVAVSTSADATGSYRRFSYQFTAFNDYPKAGVWPDGYYVSFNMFNASGTAFLGGRACVLDRNQMIAAAATPGPIQCFQLASSFGGLLPADQDGAADPPPGSPNYFVAFGTSVLQLWKFHTDWATPANSTFAGPTNIPVAAFSEACGGGTCIPQMGVTQQLDSLADRLMYRLAYRNFGTHESLVTNHSVTAGTTPSGVRWYEVRSPGGAPTVFQQGTFSPDATSRWMGSIAMDQQGNMLLGYSASSSSLRPSIRITGRAASDPLSTMQAETTVMAGTGSQTGSNLSRWGDYSAMTVDPVDDCTFWFTTEYLKANGAFNWSTRIASYRFPGCGGAPAPDFSVSCNPSSFSIPQGGSAGATCTVASTNGFASAVALSCAGLPSGTSCAFVPASVTPPANGSAPSTLTLSVTGTATTGTFPFQVQGTSGAGARSAALSLTVTPVGGGSDETAVFDTTLQAPRCGTVGRSCDTGPTLVRGRAALGPEPNQPNTIADSCADGTSGAFHSDESNDALKVSTTDGSPFAPGKIVRIEATVWAWTTPGSDALDLYYAANAASPSWTFLATLTPTVAGAQTLSATYTLPSGALQAVRAQFRYQGSASACTTGGYNDRDDLVFAVNTPAQTVVFADDFETDKGWARNPNGTDTATLGLWERGDPAATTSGGAKQLGTTTSGLNDLVTGRLAGASAGAQDVDGGVTTMQSPPVTLPATGTLTLSFQYYLAHGTNSSTADFFRVYVVAGAVSTQVFQSLGAASNRNGAWTPVSVGLGAFAGQTIRLRVEAADAAGASLVEAAVDDVRITQQ